MKLHQKIYVDTYGEIPIDSEGRKYDIHHIDGNHSNNHPLNLKAISIQEHYSIHYSKGDWAACHRLGSRISKSPEELSELSKRSALKRVQDGTHHFLNKEWQKEKALKSLEKGTHNFLNKDWHKKRVRKQLNEGNHPFVNRGKVICPHCQKEGDVNLMKRWHFDNCKAIKVK